MIAICPNCNNHNWDKIVTDDRIRCTKCGHEWSYVRKPLFILNGCSGIDKSVPQVAENVLAWLNGISNRSLFTGKADNYAKGRPSYAQEAFRFIFEHLAKVEGKVADIGSGVGKLPGI